MLLYVPKSGDQPTAEIEYYVQQLKKKLGEDFTQELEQEFRAKFREYQRQLQRQQILESQQELQKQRPSQKQRQLLLQTKLKTSRQERFVFAQGFLEKQKRLKELQGPRKAIIPEVVKKHFEDIITAKEKYFAKKGDKAAGVTKGYVATKGTDPNGLPFMMKITERDSTDQRARGSSYDEMCFVNEFVTGPLYKRTLYDRTPVLSLVDEIHDPATSKVDPQKIGLRSKFLRGFQTVSEFTKGKKPHEIGDEYQKLQQVEGVEKVFAAMLVWGEDDINAGNIGVMQSLYAVGEDGRETEVSVLDIEYQPIKGVKKVVFVDESKVAKAFISKKAAKPIEGIQGMVILDENSNPIAGVKKVILNQDGGILEVLGEGDQQIQGAKDSMVLDNEDQIDETTWAVVLDENGDPIVGKKLFLDASNQPMKGIKKIESRSVLAKIDHGWSGTQFFTDPYTVLKNLANAFWIYGYQEAFPLNAGKFKAALDEITSLSGEELEKLVGSRVDELRKMRFELSGIDFEYWQDDTEHYHDGKVKPKLLSFKVSKPLEKLEKEPAGQLAKKKKEELEKDYKILEEHYLSHYRQQIVTMNKVSEILGVVSRIIVSNDPRVQEQWQNGEWLQDIDGLNPRAWAAKKGKKIKKEAKKERSEKETLKLEKLVHDTLYRYKGEYIHGKDSVGFAAEQGVKIDGKDPIVWAVDNEQKIGVERNKFEHPIAWAAMHGIEIDGKDPIAWAVEHKHKIGVERDKFEDPIAWAVDHEIYVWENDPLDSSQMIGRSPIEWAIKHSIKIEDMTAEDWYRKYTSSEGHKKMEGEQKEKEGIVYKP